MDKEEVLAGGNSNDVVRVGGTVHRTAGPWTPSVHRLLRTLRAHGITEVPEPLGIDERGREVVSYLPGDVANYPLPDWLWTGEALADAARLLRRIHDAGTHLPNDGDTWQLPAHAPAETICHNDFAPYNMVFRDGVLVGVIDFDTASPGPRIWDLAYLAYRMVPFVRDAGPGAPAQNARLPRLDALIAAYGADYSRTDILEAMASRLDELAEFTDGRATATGRDDFIEHAAMYRSDAARMRDLAQQL
jgi:hypothetical protein